MSDTGIFVIGFGTSLVCLTFVVVSFRELRSARRQAEERERRRTGGAAKDGEGSR